MDLFGYFCLELVNGLLSYFMSSKTVSKATRFIATMSFGTALSLLMTMVCFNHSHGLEALSFCTGLVLSSLLAYAAARFPCC